MMERLWDDATSWCEANPELSLLLGAFVLLLLFWLLVRRLSRKPKQVKAFSDEVGSVYVTVHAITDLIRATCEHIPGISRPRINLRQKKGVTSLELRMRLESGSRIREIREAIRKHLRNTLETNLGFDHLGDITVVIDEYKPGPADSNVVIAAPAPAPAPREEIRDEVDSPPDKGSTELPSSSESDPASNQDPKDSR